MLTWTERPCSRYGSLVDPTPLVPSARKHFLDRLPEAERASSGDIEKIERDLLCRDLPGYEEYTLARPVNTAPPSWPTRHALTYQQHPGRESQRRFGEIFGLRLPL